MSLWVVYNVFDRFTIVVLSVFFYKKVKSYIVKKMHTTFFLSMHTTPIY